METPEPGLRIRLGEALRTTVPMDPWGRRLTELAGALLVFGWATGRPSLFLGAALLAGLYLAGHAATLYAACALETSWSGPDRVYAGEPFPVRLTVRNHGRFLLHGVEVHDGSGRKNTLTGLLPRLAPGQSATLEVRGRVRRRGLHRLSAPHVAIRWPLGLSVHLRLDGRTREVLAYPRRVSVPHRALRSLAAETAPRETVAASPHHGELFRGVREWAPGDPPRAVAWRATARHGKLLTREFEREDGGSAVVALDVDARALPVRERAAAVERAVSLAASLLLRLRARGRRTTFVAWTPGPVLVPSVATERGLGRALETLAMLRAPRRGDPVRDPLALLPPDRLRGARVVLVLAAGGEIRTRRGPGRSRVVVIPAFRAAFAKGRRR